MPWNDAPPTKEELATLKPTKSWMDQPPTPVKLGQAPAADDSQMFQHFFGTTPKKMIGAGLEALPTVGTVGGGLIGMGGGPVGAMAGAGLGGAAGESLRQLGKEYLLGEEKLAPKAAVSQIGEEAGKGILQEAIGIPVGLGIKAATPLVEKMALKTGEALSGIPKKAIQVFKRDPKAVQDFFAANEGNLPVMADQVKKFANDAIYTKKAELNKILDASLEGSSAQVDIQPIKRALIDAQTHLDPKVPTDAKQIKQIEELITEITNASDNGTTIPIQTANRFNRSWQEKATQSYAKPGEIYSLGSDSARAAKKGAAEIRTQINAELPALAKANETHSQLHRIEDRMHQNLIGEGKPEATLLAAGSGANQRNENILKELSEITGKDIIGEAEKLSAARYFGNPSYLAEGPQTGAMIARKGLGGKIGAGVGALTGGLLTHTPAGTLTGGFLGKQAGEMFTSPAVLANTIKAINAGEKVSPEALRALRSTINRGLIQQYLEKEK